MTIGFGLFSLFIVCLELFTGCAVIGWAGDKTVVERDKSPGPYWLAITLHLLAGIGLPALWLFAS